MSEKNARTLSMSVAKRIFIVDDSSIIRERIMEKLGMLPMDSTVSQAKDFQSANQMIDEEQPDIAILDIQLPDGSGIDLLTKIKTTCKKTIVIMLTNYPYSIIRKRCDELGADYFFDKSTEFEKVLDVLENGQVTVQ
jgi:DNA-binding response OmpR family regulator